MNPSAEARERLVQEDPTFRRLAKKHREYDDRLQVLQSRKYLTEAERIEEINLKKLKLALKDQMEAILRQSARA